MEELKQGNIKGRTTDRRYLTLRQTLIALDKGTLDEETFCKLEAVDPKLHGITVGAEGGTVVESKELGKGRVVACGVDTRGYGEYAIKWEKEGVDDSKYSTYQVLRCATGGTAESFDSTVEYMTNCLCAIVCLAYTHRKKCIFSNCKRNVNAKKLTGCDERERAKRVRARAWTQMLKLTVGQTMSEASLSLREHFHSTVAELNETKLSEVLHLPAVESGDKVSGRKAVLPEFMDPDQYDKDFTKRQMNDVNVLVQALQSAINLGRPVAMESILFPMTPAEMPPGTFIPEHDEWLGEEMVEEEKVVKHGVAVKSILALARGVMDNIFG